MKIQGDLEFSNNTSIKQVVIESGTSLPESDILGRLYF